jgi:two-component system, chemotaxis family, protein-glutamate methylesterase/glutaminase
MPKIRVLIVDDSVVMRRMISDALSRDPMLEIAGVASHGGIALQKIPQVNPDAIILDVEMPEMDGITTLREIRKLYAKLPVIMFSTLTAKGAVTTIEALSAGASDYVCKPANMGSVSESMQRLESDLIPKIKALCGQAPAPAPFKPMARSVAGLPPVRPPSRAGAGPVGIVCIGTSTGGPNALVEVFKLFPKNFPVPMVIVQHMPPVFTALLAERLTSVSGIKFTEGKEGDVLRPGEALIAPGGRHMEVIGKNGISQIHLHDGPPENSCRPAVDVLFRSVVGLYGGATLGVILTGMGQDGMRGCELIRERRGQVLVQDEASSVVWGMPGAVVHAGLVDKILPLDQMCGEIVRCVKENRFAPTK